MDSVKINAPDSATRTLHASKNKAIPKHTIMFLRLSGFHVSLVAGYFFPQHMLRVSFSPGRDNARRHCWIASFATPGETATAPEMMAPLHPISERN